MKPVSCEDRFWLWDGQNRIIPLPDRYYFHHSGKRCICLRLTEAETETLIESDDPLTWPSQFLLVMADFPDRVYLAHYVTLLSISEREHDGRYTFTFVYDRISTSTKLPWQ